MCLSSLVYPQKAKLNNQTYKFYNQIISEILQDENDSILILREDINNFPIYKIKPELDYLMEVLEEKDADIIERQLEERLDFKYDTGKMINVKIIPKKFTDRHFKSVHYWDIVRAEYGKGYYSFRKPIFSKNMKRLYFVMGYCCGSECGKGFAGIYEEIIGRWELVKACSSWGE